jgi:hypothetical protein
MTEFAEDKLGTAQQQVLKIQRPGRSRSIDAADWTVEGDW